MSYPGAPFGQWLRTWRKDNRYSLTEFSDLSGVSRTALFELEHGSSFNPTLHTLVAISKATKTRFSRVAQLAYDQQAKPAGEVQP